MKALTINKEIGNRIKLARISKNLSQDSVAEDLGISVSAYSNMERGAVDITVARVIQVAEILKINWLLLISAQQLKTTSDVTIPQLDQNQLFLSQNDSVNYRNILKEIDVLKQEIKKLKKAKVTK
jgi:transcriptional regulator with XRE-family HTH domain